jgi:hypothetical protein
MKKSILIVVVFALSIFFTACNKTGCDDCATQKREFCMMLMQVGCNSAMLTNNIDYLVQACGQDDASNYISAATDSCTKGTLVCPDECE